MDVLENMKRIAAMDALLFAIILEVVLLQMRILEGNQMLAERDVHENDRRKRDKLTRDRKTVNFVIKNTLVELAESGQWFTIKYAADTKENNALLLTNLQTKNEQLKRSLKNAYTNLLEHQLKYASELEHCDENVSSLLDQLKDCVLNTSIQLEYAEKWLVAQAESQDLQLHIKPASLPKLEHENCVHTELLRAYELQIQERETSLKYWEAKFRNDTKEIKEKVKEERTKLKITTERRLELENLYSLHEGEMRGWLIFKKERAARLAREERARKSATRIQAWWRGIMVRRGLGAFRSLKSNKKGTAKPKKINKV